MCSICDIEVLNVNANVSKHTPGPWKLLKFEDDERYEVTDQSGTHGFHRAIATVSFGFSEPAETQQHANAKLIAAAPKMYEWLDKIVEQDGAVLHRELIQIQALLREIEG